jgi:hypothetical protein
VAGPAILLGRPFLIRTDWWSAQVGDGIVSVPDNYPSKGTGERGAFFRDSEGKLLALGEATH